MRRRRRVALEGSRRRFTPRGEQPDLSGYRAMWLFAMFDLPVVTKAEKKRAAKFRRELLQRGFMMMQFSVYARHCSSEEFAAGVKAEIRGVLPDEGQVRLLAVTDRQFGKMEVHRGKKRGKAEEPPPQLMLF